jgi:UPF0716 protein FxsA
MWLFLAFLAVPLIEIALFIQIGGAIGLGWTLAIVIFTAILGTWLVRTQGLLAMTQLRGSFAQMRDPTEPLANGAMILFAGALLLTPGFFTDAIGFSLLMPPVRRAVFNFVRARVSIQTFAANGDMPPRNPAETGFGDVIDGEFQEVPPNSPANPRSGLTKD